MIPAVRHCALRCAPAIARRACSLTARTAQVATQVATRTMTCSAARTAVPRAAAVSSPSPRQDLLESVKKLVEERFPVHPFSSQVTNGNVSTVMAHYLAMSEAFPFLQAGAYRDLILASIFTNKGITKADEETFVVGAFLSFDETGGNYLLRTKGIAALPRLLDTGQQFHAALLKQDMRTIFGREIKPDYRGITALYLTQLMNDLGAGDPIQRCAAMVAFELHAGQMIEALWKALQTTFPTIDRDALEYFRLHVGGDDPQEEYHKQLTKRLSQSLVPQQNTQEFLRQFEVFYQRNIQWCAQISGGPQ
jgi:hypothetical protein